MTEAWLLLDELAIRSVAGKPGSTVPLNLPSKKQVERVADPKALLRDALLTASCTTGRRRKNFARDLNRSRAILLQRLDRGGPVTELPSWNRMISDLDAALLSLGP